MGAQAEDAAKWLQTRLPEMEEALAELVRINSHTYNPEGGRRVGASLRALFALPGVEAQILSSEKYADHLVFRTRGASDLQPVAMVGHLDTVFPPGTFEGYVVDGHLRRGPGVLDMKGGLVVIAFALKALAETVGLDRVPPLRI